MCAGYEGDEEDGPYDIHLVKWGSKQLHFEQAIKCEFGIPTFRTSHRVGIPVMSGDRPFCGCCFPFVRSRRCPKRPFACVALKSYIISRLVRAFCRAVPVRVYYVSDITGVRAPP